MQPDKMVYYEFRAMNTDILMAAERPGGPHVSTGFEQARAFIEASERRLSRFLVDSELSRLNRSAGTWFQASRDLFDLVQSARLYYQDTGGLFNPAVLSALENAGYDRSMELLQAGGVSRPFSADELSVPGLDELLLDHEQRAVYLPEGMSIDLGGIAKGWITEQAARLLATESSGACAVSAGGDMFMIGVPPEQESWQVSLEDPRDPEQTLAILDVGPGAVATSSVTRRRWRQDGRVRHHLIDPRTGEPAESRWLSVTVIAPQAAAAEVYAKTLLIADLGDWQALLPSENMIAIGVDRWGKLWGTQNSWEVLHVHEQIAAG